MIKKGDDCSKNQNKPKKPTKSLFFSKTGIYYLLMRIEINLRFTKPQLWEKSICVKSTLLFLFCNNVDRKHCTHNAHCKWNFKLKCNHILFVVCKLGWLLQLFRYAPWIFTRNHITQRYFEQLSILFIPPQQTAPAPCIIKRKKNYGFSLSLINSLCFSILQWHTQTIMHSSTFDLTSLKAQWFFFELCANA